MFVELISNKITEAYYKCQFAILEKYLDEFEKYRKDSYDICLKAWQEYYEDKKYTKNDLELDRIKGQHDLDELRENIMVTWVDNAYLSVLTSIVDRIFSFLIFVPGILLLMINRVGWSQIAVLIAIALIFASKTLYNFGCITRNDRLASKYASYGAIEAQVKAADYRGLSNLDSRPIVTPIDYAPD